jgi:hypothetical protein
MTTLKEELLASNLRQQISSLEGILAELEKDPIQDKEILLKTRCVEAKLKELRSHLMPHPF